MLTVFARSDNGAHRGTIHMRLTAVAALVLAMGLGSAASAANLITNGNFDSVSSAVAALQGTGFSGAEIGDDYKYHQALTGWTSGIGAGSAFNLYYFGDGTQKTLEADTQYGELGQHANANYTPCTLAGCGGAFMILDGDPGFSGTLSQSVSGLTIGQTYDLSFDWAAGELADRTGFDTDQLTGSITGAGTVNFATALYTNTAGAGQPGSFSGWSKVDVTFKADATTEVISFLSVGTPAANLPPVSFLDGVSLTSVPEPAAWGLMLLGFTGLGAAVRRRRRPAAA
jgi:hypothetical protein